MVHDAFIFFYATYAMEHSSLEDLKPLLIGMMVLAAVVGVVNMTLTGSKSSFDIRSRASGTKKDCHLETDRYFTTVTPIPEPTKKAREYTKKLTECLMNESKR
jgi:hypothetical protein